MKVTIAKQYQQREGEEFLAVDAGQAHGGAFQLPRSAAA